MLKDSKMMKARLRANFKRSEAFFAGSLNIRFFNRNGCIELCPIVSFTNGYPLKYMQFMKGLKTKCHNTASWISNHWVAILQITEVDLLNAELSLKTQPKSS